MTRLNEELGKDTMVDLIGMIKGFDYTNANTGDNLALAQALKLVATDLVARHAAVKDLQRKLTEKIAIADVAGELAGVINELTEIDAPVLPRRTRRWYYLKG
jgi:hypothetical protein